MAIFLLVSSSWLSSSSPILQLGKYFNFCITFCVSPVKFPLRFSTVGTTIGHTPMLLLLEIHNLVLHEATLLTVTSSQCLSSAGTLRQANSWESRIPPVGGFGSRIPICPCQNYLQLHSSLWLFYPKFLLSLFFPTRVKAASWSHRFSKSPWASSPFPLWMLFLHPCSWCFQLQCIVV